MFKTKAVQDLTTRLAKKTDQYDKLKTQAAKLQKELDKANEELKVANEKAAALAALKLKDIDVQKRLLKVERREELAKTKEEVLASTELSIKEARDAGYKEGYSDGSVDGVRKGMDITADDRRMMASIAAMAAASHSDGATQTIANEIVKGMNSAYSTTASLSDGKAK